MLNQMLAQRLVTFSRGLNTETIIHNRDYLKEKLVEIIPDARMRVQSFAKEHSNTIIDNVSVGQIFGGMREIKALYHEPSLLDSQNGISYRGYSCFEIQEKLPKLKNTNYVSPEAVFWLLLTGEVPTLDESVWLSQEWSRRAELPHYLVNLINSFPDDLHPMAQLSAAVTLLSRFSKFSISYNMGNVSKNDLWKPMYEDCMNLLAKLPSIAALIYRNTYHDGSMLPLDTSMDWAQNFTNMLNINRSPEFNDFIRLFLWLHADHEGGNVSTHTAHLVGSALSDIYLCYASAMNGLAGPLHGRANQEVVEFICRMKNSLGNNINEKSVEQYCRDVLSNGVIPGFGHAVLRQTDPRSKILREFAKNYKILNVETEILDILEKIVPELLKGTGKVKNPWPNVDFSSGTILRLVETEFFTVPFALSRAIGVCCAVIWDRILCLPLERPKSFDLKGLQNLVSSCKK